MNDLTEAQIKVLEVLRKEKEDLHDRVLGPGYIGAEIWGQPYRKPQAYARIAGKVLIALRKKGLADWRSEICLHPDPQYGWTITFDGLKALKEINHEKAREKEGLEEETA